MFTMTLRADLTHRQVVRPGGETWQSLVMPGAEGYTLERGGDDLRETSRFARDLASMSCCRDERFHA
jgi:hypothetical protein